MTADELKIVLKNHRKWLRSDGGAKADLRSADLRSADLSSANLRSADLRSADLRSADLRFANLSSADLRSADLRSANLSSADLRSADLRSADLSSANLSSADLRSADLSSANLSSADLSSAKNLADAPTWLAQFKSDAAGLLVFKALGNTLYAPPAHWVIETGSVLTEVCNPDRCTICGCGVNFGTEEFCRREYPNSTLWLCRIAWMDLAGVIVPFNTDGKARCSRLTLLEVVK